MRFVVPLILFATAGWVYTEATDGDGAFTFFPFVEKVVEAAQEDLVLRGKLSAGVLAVFGAITLLRALQAHWAAGVER